MSSNQKLSKQKLSPVKCC